MNSIVWLVLATLALLPLAVADEHAALRQARWQRPLRWLWYGIVAVIIILSIDIVARGESFSPAFRVIWSFSWTIGLAALRFPRHGSGSRSGLPLVMQAMIAGLVLGSALEFDFQVWGSGKGPTAALLIALGQIVSVYQDVLWWAYDCSSRLRKAVVGVPRD